MKLVALASAVEMAPITADRQIDDAGNLGRGGSLTRPVGGGTDLASGHVTPVTILQRVWR